MACPRSSTSRSAAQHSSRAPAMSLSPRLHLPDTSSHLCLTHRMFFSGSPLPHSDAGSPFLELLSQCPPLVHCLTHSGSTECICETSCRPLELWSPRWKVACCQTDGFKWTFTQYTWTAFAGSCPPHPPVLGQQRGVGPLVCRSRVGMETGPGYREPTRRWDRGLPGAGAAREARGPAAH